MAFKRWDIVKIPYPLREKPAREHRPALVIVAGELFKHHGLLWVLMITSAKNRGWPGDIEIGDVMAAGLFFPGHHAPHVAIAFGHADVGDTVRHSPVAGWIRRQSGRKTCRQK